MCPPTIFGRHYSPEGRVCAFAAPQAQIFW
jgi:hypothetical protein